MTDEQFELLKEVLRIKKTRDINGNSYYSTTWGKKSEQGLKETIENILKEGGKYEIINGRTKIKIC